MFTVEIKNIVKTFGSHLAIDGLSLNVPEGSIYGFIGPNGSGKTGKHTGLATIRGIGRCHFMHLVFCLGRRANIQGGDPDAGDTA